MSFFLTPDQTPNLGHPTQPQVFISGSSSFDPVTKQPTGPNPQIGSSYAEAIGELSTPAPSGLGLPPFSLKLDVANPWLYIVGGGAVFAFAVFR